MADFTAIEYFLGGTEVKSTLFSRFLLWTDRNNRPITEQIAAKYMILFICYYVIEKGVYKPMYAREYSVHTL